MSLIFRPAQENDLKTLVNLLADDTLGQTREDNTLPLNKNYLEAFKHINQDPNNILLVVEFEKQVAGMLQLTFIPYLTHVGSWRCLIEGVRIDKAFRGQGLGKQMIQWCIDEAKKRQCKIIQLTSDKQRTEAIHFYQQLGFEATHEGFKLKLF